MAICMKNDKKILCLNLYEWDGVSNNIYDNNTKEVGIIKAFIEEATYIVRKNDVFINRRQHADIQQEEMLLFHVRNDTNNIYLLSNPIPKNLELNQKNFNDLNNKIWYVLKTVDLENHDKISNCNEEYYLNQNDLMKIGKVKYAVQKIHLLQKKKKLNCPIIPAIESKYKISELNKSLNPVFEFIFPVKYFSKYINQNNNDLNENIFIEKYNCKYCIQNNIYEDNYDDGNFLISICKCKELVHFNCLKNHLKNLKKKNDENENITEYDEVMTFSDFECPTCKNQFPIKFKLENNDKTFYLIDIKEPTDCNYMILESIDYKQNDKYCKSIHLIKFLKKNGEPFTIGRDNDNDIIDRDISISRHHAILRFNDRNGQISIQDWNSKFGTSILIRKPFNILDKTIYLQVGKTFIEANLMNKKDYFEEIKRNHKVIIIN